MEAMTVRLLPYEVADGPHNMAADEVLLQTAVEQHIASLRFYGWNTATVSLGYFEPAASRHARQLDRLPWVRRPTGGGTLIHHHEVTYAIAMPPNSLWRLREPSIFGMHAIIYQALVGQGVRNLRMYSEMRPRGAGLCFEQHTHGDVLCQWSKIIGSAQRRHRQALLQHGGILLAQSAHTPTLPGLRETAGVVLTAAQVQQAVAEEFAKTTGWTVLPGHWTLEERRQIEELATSKYSSPAWNEKR